MNKKSLFHSFVYWLESTEMFARPSRKVPGKWQLFEYFTEPSGELIHVKEEQLKKENSFWEIEFEEDGRFRQKSGLTIKFQEGLESCKWSLSRNFITFINPDDFRRNDEFQFAIVNDDLKLLKKDETGKILFFGFFRRLD
jgi:hypothetical protein